MTVKRVTRYAASALGLCVVTVVFHAFLLDGIQGELLARTIGDSTAYAAGYSNAGFRKIHAGMPLQDVRRLLGAPIGETWVYEIDQCDHIHVREGAAGQTVQTGCEHKGIQPRMSTADIVRILGQPREFIWMYSESSESSHYRERIIYLRDGKVTSVITGVYID